MKELILKWSLKNAVEHEGKAQVGAVIPKVIGEKPELKENIKDLAKETAKTVAEVNKLSLEQQIEKLKQIAPELLEKKKEAKYELPDLPNVVQGKVVMMFPPEPSKYATIGHARACWLNYSYSQRYDGKFLIRMEDTNAHKVKKEFYDLMLQDLKWIGVKWDRVDYISDHIDEMYKDAESLIQKENAYMCNCPVETSRKMRAEEKECKCRDRKSKENFELWKKMLDKKLGEGEYSLRAKIDMRHKNAAMRDPTLMRVLIGTHPRVGDKYYVWPTYDFATAIMNRIEGITHRLRGKEFELRAEIQDWIQQQLGIKPPVIVEFARSNLEGIPSSGRIMREKIESGEVTGWDDPRLQTLIAIRKRGFQPKAIQNFILKLGLTKTEAVIQWDILEAENRKVIESISDRYFFVKDKIKLKVRSIPKNFSVERIKHPDYPDHGQVEYKLAGGDATFYVDRHDFLEAKQDSVLRLMDLMNIKVDVIEEKQIIADFESKEYEHGVKVIHWVLEKENIPVEILMANAELWKGLGEKALEDIKEEDIVQFIRFGYAVLEKKGKTLKFRFTHR